MNEPTVIEQLCDSYIGSLESDSEENKAAYARCEAEYSNYNPNPTTSEQSRLFSVIAGYGEVERREGFIDGFKLAVKLMGEVYAAPESNQRGADT